MLLTPQVLITLARGGLAEASESKTFTFAGRMVGIYACAEHEFSIAEDYLPGANPFDPLWSLDHVVELKRRCDYVVVLYHGGKEHYRYPSPQLQRVCKRIVDKGADLVVCQHSHCVGCMERYREGTIIYGQGNFLFDFCDSEFWQTGLLVRVDQDFELSYIPFSKRGGTVRLVCGDEGVRILNGFNGRSAEIQQDGFVRQRYTELAESMLEFYLTALRGKPSATARIASKLSSGLHISHQIERTIARNRCFVL